MSANVTSTASSTSATSTSSEVLEHAILVIDDEQNIVNAIRRELSAPPLGRHRYLVEGFTDPKLALERAKQQDFDVVITDYRMPGMDGFQFLKELYLTQPDCSRIVLSGQTDMDTLARMINETHIYRFIPKPWNTFFLKSSIAQAVQFRRAHRQNRLMARKLADLVIDVPGDNVERVEHILVVDDEIDVANAVVRELTQRGRLDEVCAAIGYEMDREIPALGKSRFQIHVAQSPIEALKMADTIDFSCVISDYLMPQMDGVKFLFEFADKQPDSVRIMLSGVANMDEVVSALDLGQIDYFVTKPWSEHELQAIVGEGLMRRRLSRENAALAEVFKARGLSLQ